MVSKYTIPALSGGPQKRKKEIRKKKVMPQTHTLIVPP
jgi:hypothetical protein